MITIQITEEQGKILVKALESYQEDLQLDDFDSFDDFDNENEQINSLLEII
jgi:hypothetical protein